MQLVTHTLL